MTMIKDIIFCFKILTFVVKRHVMLPKLGELTEFCNCSLFVL